MSASGGRAELVVLLPVGGCVGIVDARWGAFAAGVSSFACGASSRITEVDGEEGSGLVVVVMCAANSVVG